jgi:hypothetical protein
MPQDLDRVNEFLEYDDELAEAGWRGPGWYFLTRGQDGDFLEGPYSSFEECSLEMEEFDKVWAE